MSGFGDIDPADRFAAEGTPDPEQVARRLQELRAANYGEPEFDSLTPAQRVVVLGIVRRLLEWLRAEGSIR